VFKVPEGLARFGGWQVVWVRELKRRVVREKSKRHPMKLEVRPKYRKYALHCLTNG